MGNFAYVSVHRQCLLFLSRIIDNRSYHDFFGITTFDHKAGKLKEFLKKVGIIFCNRHQFLVFETDNISLKVGITFFSECVKSAILLKNEFSHFAFLNKSSIFNGLSKRLSRLFTAIASLEKFINGRKVTHIITTFFRGNGANTTFLIKSHDTKKVVITTKLYPLLPTTPGTANLTNFPKRKTPQSATFQSLYINKNERTLFPRFVVVGFLYSFCSSRQDFQIFFTHTVKHGIELTAARGFLLFPFREKELVY